MNDGKAKQTRSVNLHVQHLHTFRDVYTLGGYAAAAEENHLSVPTIWQHIRAVERIYGVKLFKKVGRRIQATPAAKQLYEALDEVLVGLESTFDLIASENAEANTITLVSGMRMMMEDLASPLSAFRKQFSNRLLIRHGNNKRAEELLLADEADLALSLEAGLQMESSLIHYEPAYSVDFLAVSPKKHPFALANTGSLRELVKHPLVVTARGTHGRDALEQSLHRERLSADIHVETDNSGFTIACVQAGMGVGILAGRPEGQLCQRLATRSLRRQLGRRQIVFMWRKGRQLTDAMIGLIEEVHRHHRVR